jgi:ionotropic glutamate receptor
MKRNPSTKEIMVDSEGKALWEGYCIDLLQKLSELMGFDYEIVPPANGEFGKRYPNGTWDGMVGDLAMGVSMIFIHDFSLSKVYKDINCISFHLKS